MVYQSAGRALYRIALREQKGGRYLRRWAPLRILQESLVVRFQQ
jgi:hypothetical protein